MKNISIKNRILAGLCSVALLFLVVGAASSLNTIMYSSATMQVSPSGLNLNVASVSNAAPVLPGTSSTVTIYGTNQVYRFLGNSNTTWQVSSLKSNVSYFVKGTNGSTITFPATFRWITEPTLSSAPSLLGDFEVEILLDNRGTNISLNKMPSLSMILGRKMEAITNLSAGTITFQSTDRYTNYTDADITINASTDVTANITNTVSANRSITLSTPVIGTSGSLGFVSDGSTRTLAILSGASITWISTNDTINATNILTASSKKGLFCWRVGMNSDGYSTNIQCWVKNQTP